MSLSYESVDMTLTYLHLELSWYELKSVEFELHVV